MIPAPQTPRRIASATSPGSVEIVPVELILLERSRRKRKVHEMGDGGLSLPAMWILHAEQLSLCILIQRSKLFAVLMLRFAVLLVARDGGAGVATRASTSALAAVARKDLLGE